MAQMVIVYSPEGEKHQKTLPNARDLVAHAGWTWKPGKEYSPVASAPYARRPNPSAPIKAQEVLDSVGSNSAKLAPSDDGLDEPEVEIVEVDDDAAEVADEGDEAEAEVVQAPARRTRRKPA